MDDALLWAKVGPGGLCVDLGRSAAAQRAVGGLGSAARGADTQNGEETPAAPPSRGTPRPLPPRPAVAWGVLQPRSL